MTDDNKAVEDLSTLIATRRKKLAELKASGNAYPNDFKREHLTADLLKDYCEYDEVALEALNTTFKIAGRIMLKRVMGKASFIHLQDMSGRMQIYLAKNTINEDLYEAFKHWDVGDIVGVSGKLFKTKTDELTLKATDIRLLTKSLRPMPDKFHGLSDHETRYRQRYVDLMVNAETRDTFIIRSKIVSFIRKFLEQRAFLEVETPMMHCIPGGATAKPFATHHHALDMPLFLRVAPELYLKRLVVGGFEKVFEINRNFRNEGLSTRHNPEFTMLEFYQAYADYHDLMDLSEQMLSELAQSVLGKTAIEYQGQLIDFGKAFTRMTVLEAILSVNTELTLEDLQTVDRIKIILQQKKIAIPERVGLGRLQIELFEATVEHLLINPTFITEYPTEVSPLARCNDTHIEITDRFELFIAGREIANGFSELNDSDDQASRFRKQVEQKDSGDDEAMHYDADYITALEYGMPPTAGEGIGIDRLAMLFTNAPSIRDVILFPHMRPVNE
jgi:lysyl-tRNA synthetase class 2